MISDFGISHALGDATITATGLIHGTPAYLAPEVARGLPTSFASDVFSLGSTLYAMLEGAPPFGSDKNAIALLHKVARGGYRPPTHAGPLAPLLSEMLATNPKRRPSMASVVESLTSVQEDSPTVGGAAGRQRGRGRGADRRHADREWRRCHDRGLEHGPPAASDEDVTTEAFEQHPPATTTVPVDARFDRPPRRTLPPRRPSPSISPLATNRRPPRPSLWPARSVRPGFRRGRRASRRWRERRRPSAPPAAVAVPVSSWASWFCSSRWR